MVTRVAAIRCDARPEEMALRLREHRMLPVLDHDGRVIGILSEADLLAKGLTASEVMTAPAITIGGNEDVGVAARLMYRRRVKRLPVVSLDGRLIGLICRADVAGLYSRPTRAATVSPVSTKEVAQTVMLDGLRDDPAGLALTVRASIRLLGGVVEDRADGQAGSRRSY